MPRPRHFACALAVIAVFAIAAPSAAAAAMAAPDITFVTVAQGLDQPTQVISTPALPGRLLVTERTGRVRVVNAATGVIQAAPYLDLTSSVTSAGGEQGLLGLVFAPDFASSGQLYVTFTDSAGSLVLRRVTVPHPGAVTSGAATSEDLLTVPHPVNTNHNGGSLAFDTAGRLLVGTGDGGAGGDPNDNARDTDRLLGKVLRLDVSRACAPLPYCIPAENPFASGGGRPEIWLWGLRNPWRTTVDPVTGLFYVADVGQDRWEELDIVRAATSGADLQWSCREGVEVFNAAHCGATARQLAPVTVMCHPQEVAGCAGQDAAESVIGGQVYRGSRLAPRFRGVYIFGDYVTGNVWAWSGGVRTIVGSLPKVTSFGADNRGELWATTLDGHLVRLDLAGAPAVAAPARVVGLNASDVRSGRVALTWAASVGGGPVVRYQYRYRATTGRFGAWRSVARAQVGIGKLRPGVRYVFSVRAANSAGPGPTASTRLTVASP